MNVILIFFTLEIHLEIFWCSLIKIFTLEMYLSFPQLMKNSFQLAMKNRSFLKKSPILNDLLNVNQYPEYFKIFN